MWKVQNENVKLDFNEPMGLVWFIERETKAGTIYEHGGATIYHRAELAIAPETGLAVVILTNSQNGGRITRNYKKNTFKSC